MKTEDDGAMGQAKVMYTNSMVRDELEVKKGIEAYSDDSKEELKEDQSNDEVILCSNTQYNPCEFAIPAARTGAEGVPAGLCGLRCLPPLSSHLAF